MAENPAVGTDLSARSFRTLTDQELTVGAILLDDSWNILTTEVPSVVSRLDVSPVDEKFKALVVQIECAMVLRVLNNPDGKLSESIDDYEYRRDSAVSTGSLYLSDVERGLLAAGDGKSDGAFTIRPAGWNTAAQPDTWTTVGTAGI